MSHLKSKQEVDTSKLDDDVAEFHIEQAMKASEVKVQAGQLSSGYESLSLWQTVKVFKVATAYCFAAAFSAATDGYQIGQYQRQYHRQQGLRSSICDCDQRRRRRIPHCSYPRWLEFHHVRWSDHRHVDDPLSVRQIWPQDCYVDLLDYPCQQCLMRDLSQDLARLARC
ncbi:hypothetical protein LB505_013180 [Fusarium chuoi]|nr:hypothetical protein LB505_013180 [Fusarium chuoi]